MRHETAAATAPPLHTHTHPTPSSLPTPLPQATLWVRNAVLALDGKPVTEPHGRRATAGGEIQQRGGKCFSVRQVSREGGGSVAGVKRARQSHRLWGIGGSSYICCAVGTSPSTGCPLLCGRTEHEELPLLHFPLWEVLLWGGWSRKQIAGGAGHPEHRGCGSCTLPPSRQGTIPHISLPELPCCPHSPGSWDFCHNYGVQRGIFEGMEV